MAPPTGPEAPIQPEAPRTGTDGSPPVSAEDRSRAMVEAKLSALERKEAEQKADYSSNFLLKTAKVAPEKIAALFGDAKDNPVEFTTKIGVFQKQVCEAFRRANQLNAKYPLPKLQDAAFGPKTLEAYKLAVSAKLFSPGDTLGIMPVPLAPEAVAETKKPASFLDDSFYKRGPEAASDMAGPRYILFPEGAQIKGRIDGKSVTQGVTPNTYAELRPDPTDKYSMLLNIMTYSGGQHETLVTMQVGREPLPGAVSATFVGAPLVGAVRKDVPRDQVVTITAKFDGKNEKIVLQRGEILSIRGTNTDGSQVLACTEGGIEGWVDRKFIDETSVAQSDGKDPKKAFEQAQAPAVAAKRESDSQQG